MHLWQDNKLYISLSPCIHVQYEMHSYIHTFYKLTYAYSPRYKCLIRLRLLTPPEMGAGTNIQRKRIIFIPALFPTRISLPCNSSPSHFEFKWMKSGLLFVAVNVVYTHSYRGETWHPFQSGFLCPKSWGGALVGKSHFQIPPLWKRGEKGRKLLRNS